MAKTQAEDDKKHGDKLQALIERADGRSSPRKRKESADDDDEPALAPDDDDDPALLQDDDEEDLLSDDVEAHRDVGEPD